MQYEPMTLTFDPNSTLNRLPTLIVVDELAKLLRVDRKTIYEMVHRKEIPGVVHVGRNIRFVREVVVEWMRSGTPVLRSSRSTR